MIIIIIIIVNNNKSNNDNIRNAKCCQSPTSYDIFHDILGRYKVIYLKFSKS